MESWADRQPKVNSLSDVIEVAQTRGAEREVRRRRPASDRRQTHTSTDCLRVVTSSLLLTAMVLERVTDTVRVCGVVNTAEGRILAGHVADLVNAVLARSASVVSAEASPGLNPPTPETE